MVHVDVNLDSKHPSPKPHPIANDSYRDSIRVIFLFTKLKMFQPCVSRPNLRSIVPNGWRVICNREYLVNLRGGRRYWLELRVKVCVTSLPSYES